MEQLVKQDIQYKIGVYCKNFRQAFLKMNRKELSEHTGIKYKTIESFERGYSSNMKILLQGYWKQCDSEKLQDYFIKGIWEVL